MLYLDKFTARFLVTPFCKFLIIIFSIILSISIFIVIYICKLEEEIDYELNFVRKVNKTCLPKSLMHFVLFLSCVLSCFQVL